MEEARHGFALCVGIAWFAWMSTIVAAEVRESLTAPREATPPETPYLGDFNGDGKDDLVTFTRQNPAAIGKAYVGLSNGTLFVDRRGKLGRTVKWHDWFAISAAEQVVVGDFDGDGRDDVATWLATTTREVFVALSEGDAFGPASVWARAIGSDSRDVMISGDVNGDGRHDLVCFSSKAGSVYVALSTGSSFGPALEEHFRMR